MIQSITGLQNSGKTLYMTYLGFLAFLNGKTILTNYSVNFPHFRIDKDFLFFLAREQPPLKNCCFLFDELWLWLDCRNSQENTIGTYFFLQSSKDDSYIYLTAQHNEQNERRIRKNLHRITNCSRVLYKNKKFVAIDCEDRFLDEEHGYDKDIIDNLYIECVNFKRIIVSMFSDLIPDNKVYIKAKPIFKLYNTKEKKVIK